MNRKQKEDKRSADFSNFAIRLFTVSLVAYAISCLYLRTYNNRLTMEVQDIQRDISELKLANATLNSEIQEIISKAKIYEMAEVGGFDQNLDNVYSIVNP